MFEFSPEARFEFLHPADAGTAFARAVACEEAIGKILNIGGGEKCRMTYYEFCNDLMSAIGIGPLPTEAFVRTEVRASSVTGWTPRRASGSSSTRSAA